MRWKTRPIAAPGLPQPQLLGNLAHIERSESPVIVNHYNVQPVFDMLADAQDRDLGGVAADIDKILERVSSRSEHWLRKAGTAIGLGGWLRQIPLAEDAGLQAPARHRRSVRGQVESMNKSFLGLGRRDCSSPSSSSTC